MSISTLFTLFVVPCIYTILAGKHKIRHEEVFTEHAARVGRRAELQPA
jgi:hypothetical protein